MPGLKFYKCVLMHEEYLTEQPNAVGVIVGIYTQGVVNEEISRYAFTKKEIYSASEEILERLISWNKQCHEIIEKLSKKIIDDNADVVWRNLFKEINFQAPDQLVDRLYGSRLYMRFNSEKASISFAKEMVIILEETIKDYKKFIEHYV